MIVTFHHTHAYDWEKVDFDQVMQPATDDSGKPMTDPDTGEPLYVQVDPQAKLATNLHGDLTRRHEVESSSTTVHFSPEAVELIQAEQAAISKHQSAKSIIAELLEDGAAAVRFGVNRLTDITVDPTDKALRTYLLEHFGVGVEPVAPPTAPEEPAP